MTTEIYVKRQRELESHHVANFPSEPLVNILNNDPVFDVVFKEDPISGACGVSSYLRLRKSLSPEIQEYVERNLKGVVVPPSSSSDDYVLNEVAVTHDAQLIGIKAVAESLGVDTSDLDNFVSHELDKRSVPNDSGTTE